MTVRYQEARRGEAHCCNVCVCVCARASKCVFRAEDEEKNSVAAERGEDGQREEQQVDDEEEEAVCSVHQCAVSRYVQ